MNFPKKMVMGSRPSGFSKACYDKYDWIDYSESQDKVYCFYCFIFKPLGSAHLLGNDIFTKTGFYDWKHGHKALPDHIGGTNSDHNNARLHFDDFRNQDKVCLVTSLAQPRNPKNYIRSV